MPVYEYRCESCQKLFEIEHRMSEKRTVCEECGGALERLISRTSFAFKGGGWYKDLYATPKPGASSDEGGSPKSTASAPAASDAASTSAPADKGSSGGSSGGAATGGGSSGSSGSGSSGSGSSGGGAAAAS